VKSHKPASAVNLSVVIPVYNDAVHLEACLESISRQKFAGRYEVIVVDNNSTDDSAAVAKAHGARLLHQPTQGTVHARALGFAQARGPIIVSTDADCIVPVDWLERYAEAFAATHIDAVIGRFSFYHPHGLGARLVQILLPVVFWFDRWQGGHFSGANFAVRREAFQKSGGFDVRLKYGEDFQLTRQLRRHKFKIKVDSSNVVQTSGRQLEEDFAKVVGNLLSLVLATRAVFGPRSEKTIALTFDDGPNPATTAEILKILATHKVTATFFVVGENVKRHPDLIRRVVAAGHTIGNHTFSHRRRRAWRRQAITQEIAAAEQVIVAAGGRTKLFRAPFGFLPFWVKPAISQAGYTIVGWDNMTFDYWGLPARLLAKRILAKARPGGIIVLHDGDQTTNAGRRDNVVAALPIIITNLQRRGYRFISGDELEALTIKP
jgi:peptidoglycan/xylan/chitin deacetylase (PgdA/CDA1 family)